MKKLFFILCILPLFATAQTDAEKMEKLRAESGVDPTRVRSRAGFSILYYDQADDANRINNRLSLNLGVNRWSISLKADPFVSLSSGDNSGYSTGFGDLKFSALNAFYVEGKHSLAGAVEIGIPAGKYATPYLSVTPSLTWAYSLSSSLFLAVQPQYTFSIAKPGNLYPNISTLTLRVFLAKFTKTGWFFVLEPRPIFDFQANETNLVISPIIGKAIGGGFNLIMLSEIPLGKTMRDNSGVLFQIGFNKNF